jgi:hypothetical protein
MPDHGGAFLLIVLAAHLMVIFNSMVPSFLMGFAVLCVALVVLPFTLLSLVRIRNGEVLELKLFLFIPYWLTRVPPGSEFDLYEAWEDPAPTGVAFTFNKPNDKYLHLGTSGNATALLHTIGEILIEQGWGAGNKVNEPRYPIAKAAEN